MHIDELDTPVDEALLMGEDVEGEQEQDAPEGDDTDNDVTAAEEAKDAEDVEQEPEAKDDKPEPREEQYIPKARFNEVNEKRKALEEEVAALRAQLEQGKEAPKADTKDVKALRREATEALLEGDMDKYDVLQDQIEASMLSKAEERAVSRLSQRMEQEKFQQTAEVLVAKYPVLDAETGDPEAIEMVVALRDAYIAKGMNMTQALVKAADKVGGMFGGGKPAETKSVEEKPDPRKQKAVLRGVETNNSLPNRGGGVGNRAQEPKQAVQSISQSEWDRMSPAEREKLLSAA